MEVLPRRCRHPRHRLPPAPKRPLGLRPRYRLLYLRGPKYVARPRLRLQRRHRRQKPPALAGAARAGHENLLVVLVPQYAADDRHAWVGRRVVLGAAAHGIAKESNARGHPQRDALFRLRFIITAPHRRTFLPDLRSSASARAPDR